MHLQRAARWIGRTNSARALEDWKKVRRMMLNHPYRTCAINFWRWRMDNC